MEDIKKRSKVLKNIVCCHGNREETLQNKRKIYRSMFLFISLFIVYIIYICICISLLAGVYSVALERNENNKVAVVGEGIDPVSLIQKFRNEMGDVQLISVTIVQEKN